MPEEKPAYKISKSPIHGTGLFAARQILEGETIVEYKGELITQSEAEARGKMQNEAAAKNRGARTYIFAVSENLYLDGDFEYNDARFINHACRTNCEPVCREGKRIFFVATQDIKEGEELLCNYALPLEEFFENPCNCGFPECVGYIVAVEDRGKLRRFLKGRRPKKR